MKHQKPLLPLFKQFIRDTESGRRLKKNGERIASQTITNYYYTYKNLSEFSLQNNFDLRICEASRLTKRELISEKSYWKKFYKKFTDFLYKKGCHDNYVGLNIKTVRVFFNYLKNEKNIFTGDFHMMFYVVKEAIEILVLSPEQLKFLIYDKEFEQQLTRAKKRTKDIFILGCITGLRYSDIILLTNKNFEKNGSDWYLKTKSQKTKTFTNVKLPTYAIDIFQRYKKDNENQPLFGDLSLFIFNRNLKELGELAGFTHKIAMGRSKQGKLKKVVPARKNKDRFCDNMSSHMMRRTAITTLLILGMPEHLVRKISGHSSSSNSFNRYVHYAQTYIDIEIDKVYDKLENY